MKYAETEVDRKLMREFNISEKISDKLLALEMIARRIEGSGCTSDYQSWKHCKGEK